MASENWRAGEFSVTTNQGPRPIAGWISEPFALDFRVYEDEDGDYDRGWCLTHLPTGYVCAGILAPLNRAFVIANEVRASADWDFTDADRARLLKEPMRTLRSKFDGELVFRRHEFGPLFAEFPKVPA